MGLQRISWVCYLGGSLLVFGSWVDLVPGWLGWTGWLLALLGWAAGSLGPRENCDRKPALSKADEIAKLDLLRKEDIISEQEFQEGKRRILSQP